MFCSNVLLTMGLKSGLITFAGDCGKAALACGIGYWTLGRYGAMLAGLMVILGHNWPVFFQFKGGKGVASSCGVMLVCFPIPALISYVVAISIIAAGLPTTRERPMTTAFLPLQSMP